VEFFSKAGKVKEAKLVMDKKTNRSKGVAYVEYYNEASVNKAVVLTGQKLLGLPVIVQRSEAEKNLLAADQNTVITKKTESVYNRLYIGSLHYNLTEDDLRLVFEPFGEVDYVGIQRDSETGRSKGYGFIQYKRNRDAKVALEKMNGFELAGRPVRSIVCRNSV
jgi:RNA-binding protein 39